MSRSGPLLDEGLSETRCTRPTIPSRLSRNGSTLIAAAVLSCRGWISTPVRSSGWSRLASRP